MYKTLLKSLLLPFGLAIVTQASAQEAPRLVDGWYLSASDSLYGINIEGANALLKDLKFPPPQNSDHKTLLVAVIDGGFDFTHPELKDRVWTNAREIADNGIDDDRNGYIDDRNGWNFLGNAAGEHIIKVGTSQFREYKRLRPIYKDADTSRMNSRQRAEFDYYKRMERAAQLDRYVVFTKQLEYISKAYRVCDSLMTACYGDKPTTIQDFLQIEVADTIGLKRYLMTVISRPAIIQRDASWSEVVAKAHEEYEIARKRVESLDRNDDDPHLKLGNDPSDFRNFRYGNNDITQDAYHGTMVSGIIAACTAAPGLKERVKIMGIRAIPDGDEYDRDVAAAIRYAVDNGAKVINMSFGKYVSPHHKQVAKAIRYAQSKDVLLVRAAGNDRRDIDQSPLYPLSSDDKGRRLENMIVVGSNSQNGQVCAFSNYGAREVDLLAPGNDILSTIANGAYAKASGTSISAPMVAGVAAMIRTVCPDLSAKQVRNIILQTVRDLSNIETEVPSRKKEKTTAYSGDLCLTHGALDAYAALQKAIKTSRIRK